MIKLDVDNWCHSCPEFEPIAEVAYSYGDVSNMFDPLTPDLYLPDDREYETTVVCKHREKCKCIKDYIEKQDYSEEDVNDSERGIKRLVTLIRSCFAM